MKLAFAITLVMTAVMVSVFVLLPADREDGPELLHANVRSDSQGRPPTRNVVDLATASGRDLYTPQMAETTIDGKAVSWPRYLVWCGSFQPAGADRYRVQDLRIVANAEPRTPAEVAALVDVPVDLPLDKIGNRLSELLAGGASGVRAAEAVFVGGRELAQAERVELTRSVEFQVRGRGEPPRTVRLTTTTLSLQVEKGHIVRASTPELVNVESPEGRCSGIGFEADPRTGAFSIQRELKGTLLNVTLLSMRGEAVEVAAGGPCRYEPADATPADRIDPKARAAGSLVLEGGVTVKQGEMLLSGRKMTLETGGERVRLRDFRIDGDAHANLPEGEIFGDRMVYESEPAGAARLVVSGPGLRAIWRKRATVIPGASPGDLTITSTGSMVLANLDAAPEVTRTLEVEPQVVLAGTDAKVEAGRLEIDLARVPSNKEGAAPTDLTTTPASIRLLRRCRGQSPKLSFAGETFSYDRLYDERGVPSRDRVRLEGGPSFTWKIEGDPTASPPPAGEDVRALLDSGPGSFSVEAKDSIELVRDPLKQAPLEARARGATVVRRLGPKGDDDLRARLAAEEIDLLLQEGEAAAAGASPLAGVPVKLTLLRAAARREIAFLAPGRMEGSGHEVEIDGIAEDVDLHGSAKEDATAAYFDAKGARQAVRAPRILYRGATRTLRTDGRTHAELSLPPFSVDGPPPGVTTRTIVDADGLAITLAAKPADASPEAKSRNAVREARADGNVTATQPDTGAKLACDKLRLEPDAKQLVLSGAPARIDYIREVDGQKNPEFVEATQISLFGDRALIAGPVKARFHLALRETALRLDRPSPAPVGNEPPPPLSPIDLDSRGDVLLTQTIVTLDGPATVRHGDPAKDGFRVSGKTIALFLAAPAPAPGEAPPAEPPKSSLPAKGLEIVRVVIEGAVDYAGGDIEGEGDVMEFDRATRRLLLYGEGRPAYLTHKGLGLFRQPRPAHVLDFSRPGMPPFYESLDKPPRRSK